MGHSEETRLAWEGGARAAICRPDRPGLRRRARRRTSGPTYRRAGGFHDRTRLTDEGRTRVAMKRERQCRAATRRQGVSQRIPARYGNDQRRLHRCARDDFLTFSLYHLKIASNFQVSNPTSIRRKKTASTGPVDAVLCAASTRSARAGGTRRGAASRSRTQRPMAQRCASAVSTSVCSSGTICAARASSYAYGRVSSMYVICDSSSCTASTPVSGAP